MGWILIGVGTTLTIVGLVMIPLPGPGFLVLFAGAAILAPARPSECPGA